MTPDFLRSIPHLRMRTSAQSLILRTRSHLIRALPEAFQSQTEDGALQVHPPLITSSDCEGAGEVFTIAPQNATALEGSTDGKPAKLEHFFGEPKYLTVSSQLHLEALSAELGNVWALSPTFRAEQSDTVRHLAEFYMLEAEFRGTDDLNSVIDQAEGVIVHLANSLMHSTIGDEHREQHAQLMKAFDAGTQTSRPPHPEERWQTLLKRPWTRITYRDAITELQNAQANGHRFKLAPTWDAGLSLEHERFLVSAISDERPLVVTHYPAEQKPFYMTTTDIDIDASTPSDDDAAHQQQTAECFDILLGDGYAEVCGGSLREHRLEHLIAKMRAKGMLQPSLSTPSPSSTSQASESTPRYPHLHPSESLGALKWYADLRRFGSSPHGGFGVGWDRLLAYLCGVGNVRDVVAFPRAWGRGDC